jgi:hypothetical protein
MTHVSSKGRLRSAFFVFAMGATLVVMADCGVEMAATYPGTVYDDDYPPDAFIATTEPIYFEGRPTYWYGGRWHYREGGHWRHYDREPRALFDRRGQELPIRHRYESPVFRGPSPSPVHPGPAPARGHFDGRGGHH